MSYDGDSIMHTIPPKFGIPATVVGPAQISIPTIPNITVHVAAVVNVTPGSYMNGPILTYQWQTSIDGIVWINIPILGTATSFLVTVLQVALNLAVVETATTVDGNVSTRSNMVGALL